LAAYAAGSGNVDPNFGYDIPAAQFAQAANPMLYQSQAVEAIRRQEELQLRQQALYSLQHQQAMQHHQGLQELEYARRLQEQQLVGQQQLTERKQLAEQQRRETLAARQQERMERYESDIIAPQADTHAPVTETPREEQVEESPQEREDKDPQTPQANLESQPEEPEDRTPEAPEPMEVEEPVTPVAQVPRGKPEAMRTAIAVARIRKEMEEAEEAVATAVPVADDAVVEVQAQAEVAVAAATPLEETPKKKPPKKKKSTPSRDRNSKKKQLTPSGPTLDDPVSPITEVEYENVMALMEQFCKVPLLSEFSRPVAQLHPEVSIQVECASLYSHTIANVGPRLPFSSSCFQSIPRLSVILWTWDVSAVVFGVVSTRAQEQSN
jgi:hypothetical protein